jgi:CHASE3 domain sensor protein
MGRLTNVTYLHLASTIGLVSIVGLTWGAGYAVLVVFALVWLHTLVLMAVMFWEYQRARRQQLKVAQAQEMASQLEAMGSAVEQAVEGRHGRDDR